MSSYENCARRFSPLLNEMRMPHAGAEWHRLSHDAAVLAEGDAAINFAAGKRYLETPSDSRVGIAASAAGKFL
jgi:hypothetical protein